MHHETALISTLAIGLVVAFLAGMVASRLKLPPLVGYLLAGVIVGPFTPGLTADSGVAQELSEIGVILLMFGVGLHFSPKELLDVRKIAVPGAVLQIVAATAMGMGLAALLGWGQGAGLIFGLSLSVASTVVLLRALEGRGRLESLDGRIAVGWLIVEDLVMVLALVLLPALAGPLGGHAAGSATDPLLALVLTLGKVALFVAIMMLGGTRIVPWMLRRVISTGSRELFTLAVLALALGVAYASATLFGVSFALGAFFAGIVVGESHLSHQAAEGALPLQDAFAVLFFVSVGMLFDPSVLLRQPLEVLAVLAVILIGKSLAAAALVLAFRYPLRTALIVAASLAQIGEFSFILAALGVSLGLLPKEGQNLILAGALLSITLNPLMFAVAEALQRHFEPERLKLPPDPLRQPQAGVLQNHTVLIGYGQVGRGVGEALQAEGTPLVVAERNRQTVEQERQRGLNIVHCDSAQEIDLVPLGLERARLLVIATPDAFEARHMLDYALKVRPDLPVVVRSHNAQDAHDLLTAGARIAIVGEDELARSLSRHALEVLHGSPSDPPEPSPGRRREA
ncbi:CPA2 family monovalent cation:H+ antiporter-2 [Deinobacterium chartae]|uniref:CPA2 family monovalent cation:H+ antiporter-2 n=1 Tax=Deinobacterium chartae TaxID=521158 RepID=A0A841I1U0_9DEIO|nr:YbaL family putative K(+) efflux transporter [Deinobacterium chartae]MBB6098954.1 CPA2 family monovalent cation:H+ antiporter-2 [Deinobacterium chartae]